MVALPVAGTWPGIKRRNCARKSWGSVSAVMKAFMETCFDLWTGQKMEGQIRLRIHLFRSQSDDQLNSLIQLATFSAQMGML